MTPSDEIIFYKQKIDYLEDELLALELENNNLKQKVKSYKFEQYKLQEIQKLAKIGSWELNNLSYNVKISDELSLLLDKTPSSKEKISWHNFLEMIIDTDNQNIKTKILENVIRNGEELAFEHTFVKKDGEVIFVRHHCKTFYNAIGQPLITVGLILDITDITKSQIELKIVNEQNRKKDQLLIEQSRLAQMGEMISMIAHQWRQPLGAIASVTITVRTKSELEYFDLSKEKEAQKYETYVNNSLEKIEGFVQDLTTTIEDFRNFYKPHKKKTSIKLDEIILKSLNIIKASLISENTKIIEEYNSKEEISLYDSELLQVILNILKNAQDNFQEKQIKDSYIKITTQKRTISICDNGGGIAEDIMEKIFDPYFSTKSKKNGTGLGLYMSKIIVEDHHNGKLTAKNTDDGVCFKIELGTISDK